MSENKEGIQFDEGATVVSLDPPSIHPTDKKFLVAIFICLFLAVGLIAWVGNDRLTKLEASAADMQIKAEALTSFRDQVHNQLGLNTMNIQAIGTSVATRDYVDRVAKAVQDLQLWRLNYTNVPVEVGP